VNLAHPRVSVSAVSSWRQGFAEDVAMWDRLSVDHLGLSLRKCEAAGFDVVRAALHGRRVSNVVECGWLDLHEPSTWPATTARWMSAVRELSVVAPWCLVLTTGAAWRLDWDESATRFAEATADLCRVAREHDVTIAIEHTGSLRVDLSFVHTLADALDLARVLDTGVCVELNSCWAERDVDRLLAAERVAHVQVSDFVIGSLSTPDRCVPGDGDIPLARLIGVLESAGYRGAYEIEMVGPRIEAEGYESALRRAVTATDALLASAAPAA
jgi:sugar phosphate isomerase/epimerase